MMKTENEEEKCPICHRGFKDIEPSLGEAYEYDDGLIRYHSECLWSYGKLSRAEYETLYKRDEND